MTVKVLFFASLRERLGVSETMLETTSPLSAREIWAKSSGGQVMPTNILVSINQTYANPDAVVQPGDEVAFFPPVTGG